MASATEQARAAAETAARQSYGKLVAFLAARSRDVAGAEDALADAFAMALARWPQTGVPQHPEAWLLAVARRRATDQHRRRQTREAALPHLKLIGDEMEEEAMREKLPDDRLGLIFACAHPAIDAGVRAPLILQTVLGFDAATIASAFLISPATMGQRLVRAKARIREAGIPFRIPELPELPHRLSAVLEAVYAAFAEGWTDPAGTETRRRNLATEAIWLCRLVTELLPEEPEALSLLALMLYAEARREARRCRQGDFVPLSEQDMALWDTRLIEEADTLLSRAGRSSHLGRYQIEAAIHSVHVARRLTGRTDWAAIRQFYDALVLVAGSPVVTINRAVAIGETDGPAAGLVELDTVADDRRIEDYQPYWAARAGLLAQLDRADEARQAYERAIGLERDEAVRRFLAAKKAMLLN